jgi:predicted RNA binding protein YcfA (HicA-like mRNA interferase family)
MSPRLPAAKPREVLRALGRAGFYVHHSSGSHYILKHPERPQLRVTVPYHNKDLKRRTLASILDQASLSVQQFLELL